MTEELKEENLSTIEEDEIPQETVYQLRQIDSALKDWQKALSSFNEKIVQQTDILKIEVERLKTESYVLNKLPDKVAEHLKAIIPAISQEIKVTLLQDLDKAIHICYENLKKLEGKAELALAKIEQIDEQRFKKSLKQALITVALAVSLSMASTFLLVRYYPHFITLNTDKEIKVDNSEVTIWGKGNTVKIMERDSGKSR